jgi:hypothetical protein
MTDGQFNTILQFFLQSVGSREQFKKVEDQLFSTISKKYGLSRNEFSKKLSDKLQDPKWKHGLTDEHLIELAHRINYYPVYLAVAKKIPLEAVRQEFPSLEKKIALEQVGTSFTSTANTAPYPVPIGKKMLRRKNPVTKG